MNDIHAVFTINDIRRLLKEYETMRLFKLEATAKLSSSNYYNALLEKEKGRDTEEFFSWVEGLSGDNIKSILKERSHD